MKESISMKRTMEDIILTNSKISVEPYLQTYENISLIRTSSYVGPQIIRFDKKNDLKNGYQCSILDYGAEIRVNGRCSSNRKDHTHIHQIISEERQLYIYGPIQFDAEIRTINLKQFKLFKVSLLLNKTEKFQGQCRAYKGRKQNSDNSILIFLKLFGGPSITLQYSMKTLKENFLDNVVVDSSQENSLKFNLKENMSKFKKFLSTLKISCHFGNFLKINFHNRSQLNHFLLKILEQLKSPIIEERNKSLEMYDQPQKYIDSPTYDSHYQREKAQQFFHKSGNLSTDLQTKIREIQKSYKKMEDENKRLKQQNIALKGKLFKNNTTIFTKEKIHNFQKNLHEMTARIQMLEVKKKKNKKIINASKQKDLFMKKRQEVKVSTNSKNIPLLSAESMKIFPPTPKLFKIEPLISPTKPSFTLSFCETKKKKSRNKI